MVIFFLASQFSVDLYLFTDKIQCWKLFLKVCSQTFSFGWFGFDTTRTVSCEHRGSVLFSLCFSLGVADTVQQWSTLPLALSFESNLFS